MTAVSLFSQAKDLLSQLRENFTSHADFVDPVTGDPDWLNKSAEELVKLLGKGRAVEFLRFSYDYSQTLSTVVNCGNELIKSNTISGQSLNAVRDLAMHRFGMGDCSELTRAALIKTASFCSSMQVVVCRDMVVASQSSWHTFLILGVSRAEYNNFNSTTRNISVLTSAQFFPLFPGKVILDPFLNFVSKTDQWNESLLGQYVVKHNMPYVLLQQIAFVPPGYPLDKPMTEAEKIYQIARKRISSAPPLQKMAGSPDWLPFLLQHDADAMIDCLKVLFPEIGSWVSKIQGGTLSLFVDGTDEITKPVSDQLKAWCMNVKRIKKTVTNNTTKKTKISYQIVLTDRHGEQLCEAARILKVFAKNIDALKLIFSYVE